MKENFAAECIEKIDSSFMEEARTFSSKKRNRGYWKQLIIKYSIIFIGIALLLCFALFNPTKEYRIEKEDGQYFIYLDPKYVPMGGMTLDSYSPLFRNSVAEMEQAFRLGDFTTQELYRLGRYADAHGVVPIFDLDNLIEPSFPDPFEYNVAIIPNHYLFNITIQSTGKKITMRDLPQDLFTQFTDIAAFHHTIRIPANAQDAQEQLQHATCNMESENSETCYYIIEGASLTYYVIEYYDTTDSVKLLTQVEMYAEPADPTGHYLSIYIHEPKERPDISWLAQFGYKTYEP